MLKRLFISILLIPLGCFSAKPPKAPPPVAPPPDAQDENVIAARDNERQRKLAAASSSLFTSPTGATGAPTTQVKSLFGK